MTKKILITGKSSYVGNQLAEWLGREPEKYDVVKISVRDDKWKEIDFSIFDVVFHVAGIAHNSKNLKLKPLYYSVNRDLTIEVAKKAKSEGVKQFIFMSSIIVFGNHGSGKTYITEKTIPNPDNFYGDSKLQAEKELEMLQAINFKVVILRPPMIYGKGSKGNYPLLSKIARFTPVFPNYKNKRSMLYIGNLCKLICLIIKNEDYGKFHPQNDKYVQTSEMVKLISENYHHKLVLTRLLNPFISLTIRLPFIKKVFGDFIYDSNMSIYESEDYQAINLKESINSTES